MHVYFPNDNCVAVIDAEYNVCRTVVIVIVAGVENCCSESLTSYLHDSPTVKQNTSFRH